MQAKAVTDIRDFLGKARRYIACVIPVLYICNKMTDISACFCFELNRKDASKLKIKKNKDGSVKFKIRCSRVSFLPCTHAYHIAVLFI